ncbi:E4 [Human papillomavirus type 203]|uniref:E4 n=2 Tax=Human papillomavirus types TaxID=173087 RepID=A0A2L1K3Y7_9PAPI|nr:E4 [Human papillomavirus type 203]AVE16216.1 E4 [Human papillomavirus type 203]AYA93782.1 MAG: E4 protein [Human papillomavirus]
MYYLTMMRTIYIHILPGDLCIIKMMKGNGIKWKVEWIMMAYFIKLWKIILNIILDFKMMPLDLAELDVGQ